MMQNKKAPTNATLSLWHRLHQQTQQPPLCCCATTRTQPSLLTTRTQQPRALCCWCGWRSHLQAGAMPKKGPSSCHGTMGGLGSRRLASQHLPHTAPPCSRIHATHRGGAGGKAEGKDEWL